MLAEILNRYNLDIQKCQVTPLGVGLINSTWKISTQERAFILQEINTRVFQKPEVIADNLNRVEQFLSEHSPWYLFPAPLPNVEGCTLSFWQDRCFRVLPFVEGSLTFTSLDKAEQAFEAAQQFGRLSRLLNDFDADTLGYTIPDFHNLSLRVTQFDEALKAAVADRKELASAEIEKVTQYADIISVYEQLRAGGLIPLRVIHHDTKISNVLFDQQGKGLSVIDLDTIMPGYFMSDVGDMMRTYLSPANEEERDLDQVFVRTDYMKAIYQGYMSEMGEILTEYEKQLFLYSGRFMIFMQALRFLTDFLNGDIYYPVQYAEHNLSRARNQFRLLECYIEAESQIQL